jgi:hypothetical protein
MVLLKPSRKKKKRRELLHQAAGVPLSAPLLDFAEQMLQLLDR